MKLNVISMFDGSVSTVCSSVCSTIHVMQMPKAFKQSLDYDGIINCCWYDSVLMLARMANVLFPLGQIHKKQRQNEWLLNAMLHEIRLLELKLFFQK